MDLNLLITWAVALGLALAFVVGVIVNHGAERRFWRKRVCSIVTADDHRNEGARLLYESTHFSGRDPERRYERYLRQEAFRHFQVADIIENGPYKH
jgi:hypothetical protein